MTAKLSEHTRCGPYNKADSILGLRGIDTVTSDVLGRVREFASDIAALGLDSHRRTVVERACANLLADSHDKAALDRFWLRPHIVEEMRRLRADELARYLFYRFRYDVFPRTRELDAYPPCVQIEPTSVCNYRCVFCYQTDKRFARKSSGHMGTMALDLFKRVVDDIEHEVEAVTLASRGEPLLCPDIEAMLKYLSGKFLGLKINTNAWLLDDAKAHALLAADANTVVFSADASTPELYAKMRVGGKLERVLENIRNFQEIRARHYPNSRTITRVSGVKFTEEQDLGEMDAFWSEHVDQVAFVDYNPWENSYNNAPNGCMQACSDLWRRTFVWWDGRVNPCDVDYRSFLAAGDARSESLTEIWRGSKYQELRDAHVGGGRQGVTPCRGCSVL